MENSNWVDKKKAAFSRAVLGENLLWEGDRWTHSAGEGRLGLMARTTCLCEKVIKPCTHFILPLRNNHALRCASECRWSYFNLQDRLQSSFKNSPSSLIQTKLFHKIYQNIDHSYVIFISFFQTRRKQSYLKQFYKTSTLSVTSLTASIKLAILLPLNIV